MFNILAHIQEVQYAPADAWVVAKIALTAVCLGILVGYALITAGSANKRED